MDLISLVNYLQNGNVYTPLHNPMFYVNMEETYELDADADGWDYYVYIILLLDGQLSYTLYRKIVNTIHKFYK